MPKFAANLSMMFNEWDFLDRFAVAAESGFSAVEFLFPYAYSPEAIAERLEKHGLTQALFNLPPGNWEAGERGLAAIPEKKEEFRSSIAKALPYAKASGVRRLHMMSGHANPAHLSALECYKENLRFACETLAPHGIDVLIEPINPRDMPGYFLNSFKLATEIIGSLALSNLKLQFDIYHRQILHGDIIKGLEQLVPLIGHVQVASVPARNEPGTGELDDFRIFRQLDRLGYDGFVGCEYRPANGTLAGLSWLKAAAAS